MKYSFAVQNRFGETLTVEGADSFEEAITRVEKGLYERDLVIGRRLVDAGQIGAIPDDIKFLLVKEGKLTVEPTAPPAPEAPAPTPEPAPAPAAPAPAPEPAPAAPEPAPAPETPPAPSTAPETAPDAPTGNPEA